MYAVIKRDELFEIRSAKAERARGSLVCVRRPRRGARARSRARRVSIFKRGHCSPVRSPRTADRRPSKLPCTLAPQAACKYRMGHIYHNLVLRRGEWSCDRAAVVVHAICARALNFRGGRPSIPNDKPGRPRPGPRSVWPSKHTRPSATVANGHTEPYRCFFTCPHSIHSSVPPPCGSS